MTNVGARYAWRRRARLGLAIAGVLLTVAACSSGGGGSTGAKSGSGGGGGAGNPIVASAQTAVAQHLKFPTKILETQKFTPKPGKMIYNVSCNLAIVGCGEISTEIGQAAKSIGYRFGRCNAGATPTQAQGCFTNAVNAKASVIVDNDVPLVGSGNGFHQANAAGIPVAGAFTGNPLITIDEPTQAAEDAPTVEAQLLAEYVISQSKGHANVQHRSAIPAGRRGLRRLRLRQHDPRRRLRDRDVPGHLWAHADRRGGRTHADRDGHRRAV